MVFGDKPMKAIGMIEPAENECRTRHVVVDKYECLVKGKMCKYLKAYGDCLYCKHPNRKDFSKKPPVQDLPEYWS
jgi:hypothetical protein